MADRNSFPQIPSTVWWGIRGILQRTPNATIDERFLGIHLGVQEAASRQYLADLRRVGLLAEDGRATPLAQRWRHDESYWDAVQEILENTYPSGLLQVAPPGDADRQRVVSWFSREGLGTGTANNKAATYLLIGSRSPNEAPVRGASPTKPKTSPPARSAEPKVQRGKAKQVQAPDETKVGGQKIDPFPLNINVQIHISADATTEQIESIFSAMRRYLYANPAP